MERMAPSLSNASSTIIMVVTGKKLNTTIDAVTNNRTRIVSVMR